MSLCLSLMATPEQTHNEDKSFITTSSRPRDNSRFTITCEGSNSTRQETHRAASNYTGMMMSASGVLSWNAIITHLYISI